MPTFRHHDATLHYDVIGPDGAPPVLLVAPGGMRSAAELWGRAPFDPRELAGLRLVAMDQRNAGRSSAPVRPTDGWHTYTADQLALMRHLGHERFAVVGMCIGGAYAMHLIRTAPERITRAVLLQPIGHDDNRDAFLAIFDAWRDEVGTSWPDTTAETWAGFRHAMFGGEFLFCASPDDVARCTTPLLLCKGDDLYHPASISDAIARLAPDVVYIEDWKTGPHVAAARQRVQDFLTP